MNRLSLSPWPIPQLITKSTSYALDCHCFFNQSLHRLHYQVAAPLRFKARMKFIDLDNHSTAVARAPYSYLFTLVIHPIYDRY